MISDFVDGETITDGLALLPDTPEAIQKCLLDGDTSLPCSWHHLGLTETKALHKM